MTGQVTADQLKSYVERIENVNAEIKGLKDDVKDIYSELHGNGYCKKTVRAIIKLRSLSVHEREESEAMLDTYLHALGMLPEEKS